MRIKLAMTLAVAAALLAPATAGAGGWATVGLDPLPDGIAAGDPWRVELTILQHGRTPLAGVHPRVIVTRSGERHRFPARASSKPGVYRAEVVFPSAGTWRYAVDDGFTQTHSFPPVRIGAAGEDAAPAAAAGGGGDGPELGLLIAAVAGTVALAGGLALRRRGPAPG